MQISAELYPSSQLLSDQDALGRRIQTEWAGTTEMGELLPCGHVHIMILMHQLSALGDAVFQRKVCVVFPHISSEI